MSLLLQSLHLDSLELNSTNLAQNSIKLKNSSTNSLSQNAKLNQLFFENIQEPAPSHFQHAVRPNSPQSKYYPRHS